MIKPGIDWDIPSAISAYNIDRWGAGYFAINAAGQQRRSRRCKNQGAAIDVMAVVQRSARAGSRLPAGHPVSRTCLRHRVQTICKAFASAIAEAGYQKPYRGVFPIKVNQLREVVEEIIDAGASSTSGWSAAASRNSSPRWPSTATWRASSSATATRTPLYIQNALLGRKLGKQIILVVEKIEELRQIVEISREMNVEPLVGFRVRLNTRGAGKWATSGGENAKFGLSTAELVAGSNYLKENNLAHCLKLVHFHVGSQVPDIGTIKRAVREAARFYAKLAKMGHDLEYMDVGGGLGVDYDGSRTAFDSSTNYTLQEYARDIVYNIMEVCDSEKVAHPIIVSESGRALVAHHSMLVIEAFGTIEKDGASGIEVSEKDAKLVQDISETMKGLSRENRLEGLHDAQQYKEQAQAMFDLGLLDLETKAKVEGIYWQIARNVVRFHEGMRYIPEEVRDLSIVLADQYFCNFSVFQSLLDHWALGQLFPIMPIHRLNESPERNATLADITCDSDGKINKFIDLQDVKDTLPSARRSAPASRIISACFSWARTRTSWATCTTSSGASLRHTSFWTRTRTPATTSRKSSRAARWRKCSR